MRQPTAPTRREREEHELTHLPFRDWCDDCVCGRGKERDHRRRERLSDEPRLPDVVMDFGQMGHTSGDRENADFVVMKCCETGHILAHAIPSKRITDSWVAEQLQRGGLGLGEGLDERGGKPG